MFAVNGNVFDSRLSIFWKNHLVLSCTLSQRSLMVVFPGIETNTFFQYIFLLVQFFDQLMIKVVAPNTYTYTYVLCLCNLCGRSIKISLTEPQMNLENPWILLYFFIYFIWKTFGQWLQVGICPVKSLLLTHQNAK